MAAPVFNDYYHGYNQNYSDYTSTEGSTNAKYLISHLMNDWGFQYGAACGLVGNISLEGQLNPNRVQIGYSDYFPDSTTRGNYGFGLCQWTPWYFQIHNGTRIEHYNADDSGTPTYYRWYLDSTAWTGTATATDDNPIGRMEPQLQYLNEEKWGFGSYSRFDYSYSYTWAQYQALTDPQEAAAAWLWQYERPGSITGSDATETTATNATNTRKTRGKAIYDYFADIFEGATPGGAFKYPWLLKRRRKHGRTILL